jgi:glyoxylase-like metal-dependent hydrolase (beta-lactamase superfamily II)
MKTILSTALAIALTASTVSAQTAANAFRGPITTIPLGSGVYQLSAGSNALLVVGGTEAVLIDTLMFNPDKLAEAVRAITPLPVRMVITTHPHRDHTGGNAIFASMGAKIIATPQAARRIAEPSINPRGEVDPPIAKEGWPAETFAKQTTLKVGSVRVQFIPVQRSHTDGDAMVFLPDANILVLSDLHHNHEYPVYDAQSGCRCGSYEGNLKVYEQALRLTNARTRIIAGHGGVTNPDEVRAYVTMLRNIRTTVRGMIDRGMSKEAVIAAKPLANDKSVQPNGPDNRDAFIGTLYTALKTGEGA